ncbi:hypothetical protein FRX31_033141, partial [Thalictrum thalictroides]
MMGTKQLGSIVECFLQVLETKLLNNLSVGDKPIASAEAIVVKSPVSFLSFFVVDFK